MRLELKERADWYRNGVCLVLGADGELESGKRLPEGHVVGGRCGHSGAQGEDCGRAPGRVHPGQRQAPVVIHSTGERGFWETKVGPLWSEWDRGGRGGEGGGSARGADGTGRWGCGCGCGRRRRR